MISKQLEAVKRLKEAGIMAKVNSIIIPGINEDHVPVVAKTVADLGADVMNCISDDSLLKARPSNTSTNLTHAP